MADKLYWNGKNAIQLTQDIAVKPGESLPDDIDKKTLDEFKENGLISEYSSLAEKAEAEKPDLEKENAELKKEIESLKKDIEDLKKSGDKKLLKENEELKAKVSELEAEIEALDTPMEV